MSIIQAYKSDLDGKLFDDKTKYISHLRKLAANRMHEKRLEKLESQRVLFLEKMGQVKDLLELNQFIKDNWKWFWSNGAAHEARWKWKKSGKPEFHEYVDIAIRQLSWQEEVSNSHSCPRGGVENFDTRADYNKGKPTGYPGWRGRIIIKVLPPTYKYHGKEYIGDGWGSSYFKNTTIHTGSGGGGNGKNCKEYSYAVTLWAADFPVMYETVRREQWLHRENYERQLVWNTLGGSGSPAIVTEVPEDWVCPDSLIPLI